MAPLVAQSRPGGHAQPYDSTHIHQPTHIGTSHYTYDLNGNLASIIPDSQWTGLSTELPTLSSSTLGSGQEVLSLAIGENRSQTVTAINANSPGIDTLRWDYANHLREVKTDNADAFYDYDVDGERRLKSLSAGANETVYFDRMYEVENQQARPLATVNVYLGDTRLVSKVIPLSSGDTSYEQQNIYYYHSDHIGNSTLITDYQGAEFERDAFTPHGEIWQESSLDTLDKVEYLFTGKQVDAETGWYNFGARYLNPTTGLWLSADPALGEYLPNAPLTDDDKKHNQSLPGNGGIYNPVNFALYHFAGNNPIRYTDPDGRDVVLLHASTEADFGPVGTYGHTATLVGNDKTGWTYFSNDGPSGSANGDKLANVLATPGGKGLGVYKTLTDFFNANAGAGSDGPRYDSYEKKSTSVQQDNSMKSKIFELIGGDSGYSIPANDCSQNAKQVMTAGGVASTSDLIPNDQHIKGVQQLPTPQQPVEE